MLPERADIDPWLLFFAIMALVVSGWTAWRGSHRSNAGPQDTPTKAGEFVLVTIGGLAAAAIAWGEILPMLAPVAVYLLLAGFIRLESRRLSAQGVAWLTVEFGALCVGWFWTCLLIAELELPYGLAAFALVGVTLGLGIGLLGCIERIAREALVTHEQWQLPTRAPKGEPPSRPHRVSFHLACYAEPPEVVKETMNRLAAMTYDDFEVLVCDNNTKDEALWRPLEEHCRVLNERAGVERFRFFHVDPLPGAKAGALNFCLTQMDPDADIVAVIDADYYSTPDFLSRLVPFFDNPRVGYLQTPHDYRDYSDNAYLTGSYWEYMPNNKVDMPGVSEYGGAFTIGTMCLLRTSVLRKVGGWAEWCLTEDSEVSVRLRAAGYRGIYLRETFGRGLIPDNFDDYKKQRFRWTAGPVQQLRCHWRLFLPTPWAPRMPGWTKLLEVLRCIAPLRTLAGLGFGLIVLALTLIATAMGTMRPVDLPPLAWAMMGLGLVTLLVRTWHRYRLTGCRSIPDMIRGEVARASLSYVVLVAGLAGLSSKPLAWRRTPKFGASFGRSGRLKKALAVTRPETALGTASLAAAIALLLEAPVLGTDIAVLSSLGLATLSFRFFCAPYMAWLAEREGAKDGSAEDAAPILPGRTEAELPA